MNASQKQRAQSLLNEYRPGDDAPHVYHMAALLQELVDAHEQKPVARVTGYYAGYLSIATVYGRVLPAGTALYAAPPHQSEQHLEMVNTPAPSVPELEEYDAGALNDFGGGNVGWWQDYIRSELGRAYEFYCDQLSAAQTPAEPPADLVQDAERYRWLRNQNNSLETQQRDKGVINGLSCYHEVEGIRELKYDKHLDCAVDAAIERGEKGKQA